MSNTIKRWGGFTILTGLGASLVAMLFGWVFSATLENSITFAPLTEAVDRLTVNLKKSEDRNTLEHNEIVVKINNVSDRLYVNETKLIRVVEDCKENHADIKICQTSDKEN